MLPKWLTVILVYLQIFLILRLHPHLFQLVQMFLEAEETGLAAAVLEAKAMLFLLLPLHLHLLFLL
jgi:hypothetical protein